LLNQEKRRMKSVLRELSQGSCRWAGTDWVADISENNPFRDFKNVQTYWPGLNIFQIPEYSSYFDCELPSQFSVSRWLNRVDSRVWNAIILDNKTGTTKEHQVFVKNCHLLDPVGILKGELCIPKCPVLPNYNKCWIKTYDKIQSRDNQAYIDCLAYFLLSRLRETDITPHCIYFYGARVGLAGEYEYKITDQFDSLRNENWFWSSLQKDGGRLAISTDDLDNYGFLLKNPHSLNNSGLKTEFDQIEEIGLDASEIIYNSSDGILQTFDFSLVSEAKVANCDILNINRRDNSEQSSFIGDAAADEDAEEDADEDAEEDADEDAAEDEIEITLISKDIPVISILQEKNEGVMDDFLDMDEIDGIVIDTPEWDNLWLAWIFQVVACLSVLQKAFLFTHNDLHSNNLVWRTTEQKYLYYRSKDGRTWKVPTYGRIFSIIDFGRSIFTFKDEIFISDDHWPGNYAGDQYNFGPFFNPEKPEICPNPSFDLSRLAISLLDGLFDEIPPPKTLSKSKIKRMKKQHTPIQPSKILSKESGWEVLETESELFNLLWSWTVDSDGKTIYVNKDYTERFPGFDLYKKISSSIKNAIPREQLNRNEFKQFLMKPNEKLASSVRVYSVDCSDTSD
jgi:hypothetical protein